ncbi:MBL fold metallo-hydrolase [bacterium]|nr:MBL fold metallo-hydrolase [bacterium]
MRLLFLGTGTSHGIPMLGCACAVCRSPDPRNQRLRPSLFIQTDSAALLLDATPDFRTQALRAAIRRIDGVLLTHTHADHVLGLDDLRTFCRSDQPPLPVFGSAASVADVQRVFPYACTEKPAWAGLPRFLPRALAEWQEEVVRGLRVQALPLPHGKLTVYGWRLGDQAAYLTDCHAVPESVADRLQGVPLLILDALRYRPHPTHLTVDQALEVIGQINPGLALLTHIAHDLEHAKLATELPAGVQVAHDQMRVEWGNGAWQVEEDLP